MVSLGSFFNILQLIVYHTLFFALKKIDPAYCTYTVQCTHEAHSVCTVYTWGPLKVFKANFPRYEMCYKMYEDSSLRRPNAENIR